MLSESEALILHELSDIKTELSEIKVAAATAVQVATSLDTRLFNSGSGVIANLQSDIQEIKDDKKTEERWNRIHNILHYSITPLLVALHEVVRKFGVPI
jgi:hypothetical protein